MTDFGLEGADDEVHLVKAAELGAVLATQNQQHFEPKHHRWQAEGRAHAGILTTHHVHVGLKIQWLERAARMLTPEIARNQLMRLEMFETEERGRLFVMGLAP